jgi:Trypsin-co-occurring domain 2
MSEFEALDGAMGLADFLSDLRAELAKASERAEHESLKLGVEEVTVELDVAVTLAKRGEASAKASAKFWVFASAEGGVTGERSSQQVTTQHLTLTLKPRTEEVIIDETGKARLLHRDVDVAGAITGREEDPELPDPSE